MEELEREETINDLSSLTEKDLISLEKINNSFEKKKRKELLRLEKRKRNAELRVIRNQYIEEKEKKKRSTTKILMAFILANCTIVEIYSMVIMFVLNDLSALYSLIGAVVGESISFAIYCTKSYKETKEEAINKLERDKFLASLDASGDDSDSFSCSDDIDNYPIGDETRDLSEFE